MRLVDAPQDGDYELLSNGVPIYVCKMSAPTLNNITINYDSSSEQSGFRFEKQTT
jgi:Fe-S cluster assembly iron-binding protein IscA